MTLPTKTVVEDIEAVCGFLGKKPTGATVKEARAVIDAKYLDGRKLTALRSWGFIEDVGDKMKLTPLGRSYTRSDETERRKILLRLVQSCPPYNAIVERAAHLKQDAISVVDVGAHWHDHFAAEVGKADSTLNDQTMTFFNVAQGAGLGEITLGRRGSPTRLVWDQGLLAAYDTTDAGESVEANPNQQGKEAEQTHGTEASGNGFEASPKLQTQGAANHELPALGQSIFLAHGKNKVPLEQLEKILRQFNIPFKVAIDEPNLGRPIGAKVREIMHGCNCAILIFTADECFYDKDGKEIWRPSENVGHELGACSYLYQNRIVIIKEDKIVFPTNYRDLGYISFSTGTGLEAKAMDVLKELIGFGIVKIST